MATKKALYEMYLSDHELHPDIYCHASFDYFIKIWRNFYPNIKCRKFLRFSKCRKCQMYRMIQYDRKKPMKARQRAKRRLQEHYQFVKRERAYSKAKKDEAILTGLLLWIAQDATDQLIYGLPHFLQLISSELKERLKMHLMIDYVAGISVTIDIIEPILEHF